MRKVVSNLAGVTVTLFLVAAAAAAPSVLTLDEALPILPDPSRYRVELAPSDMAPEQMSTLMQMIGDAARGQHFYGAVYSYRPAAGGRTEFSMRSGLHSRAAAQKGALADCEAARGDDDGTCILVGEILPEGWTDATPELSHVAVDAMRQTAESLPGNVTVARSADGDGYEIRSGDDVRDQTLEACNQANAEAGLPEDCAIVIDDLATGN